MALRQKRFLSHLPRGGYAVRTRKVCHVRLILHGRMRIHDYSQSLSTHSMLCFMLLLRDLLVEDRFQMVYPA